VPESSQARGSDVATSAQLGKVLLTNTLAEFLGPSFVFDGASKGFSPSKLFPVGESRSTTISLGSRMNKPNEVEVEVRNVGTLDIRGLFNYLENGRIDLNPTGNTNLGTMLSWLNAIFRDDPARRMVSRPNSNAFFQRSRETSMTLASTGGVLEALRGKCQPDLSI
jgi:hypothetical protein